MNLYELVQGGINGINPTITGSLYRSKGFRKIGVAREALYEAPVPINLQIQSVSDNELNHGDGLNQQGEKKIVYASDQLYGVDRVRETGADILEFYGRRWKVIQRLEGWEMGDWCKVLVVAQLDRPQDDETELLDYVGNGEE